MPHRLAHGQYEGGNSLTEIPSSQMTTAGVNLTNKKYLTSTSGLHPSTEEGEIWEGRKGEGRRERGRGQEGQQGILGREK